MVIALKETEYLHNSKGTLHGGIISTVADAAMGYTMSTILEEGELFTTVELKVNFLKAVTDEAIFAESKIIKRGSKVSLLECYVKDQTGSLIAHATSTCMIIKSKKG